MEVCYQDELLEMELHAAVVPAVLHRQVLAAVAGQGRGLLLEMKPVEVHAHVPTVVSQAMARRQVRNQHVHQGQADGRCFWWDPF